MNDMWFCLSSYFQSNLCTGHSTGPLPRHSQSSLQFLGDERERDRERSNSIVSLSLSLPSERQQLYCTLHAENYSQDSVNLMAPFNHTVQRHVKNLMWRIGFSRWDQQTCCRDTIIVKVVARCCKQISS